MTYKRRVIEMLEKRTDDPNARVYRMLYTILQFHPEPVKKDLYTLEDVRTVLGLSQRQVYRLIKAGKINATKPGRTYVVTAEEFERLKKGLYR